MSGSSIAQLDTRVSDIILHHPSSDDHGLSPKHAILAHTRHIEALVYFPNGRRIVTGSLDGAVKIWNVEDGGQEGPSMMQDCVLGVAVTRDGTKIICTDWGNILVWDVESRRLVKKWGRPGFANRLALSPDDRFVAVRGIIVGVYNLNGTLVHVNGLNATSLCFSPDGTKLACCREDISVYDVVAGTRILGPLKGHQQLISSLLWSHDGTRIFSGSWDKTIRCWDSTTGQQIGDAWTGHTKLITSLSLSPDGFTLASASSDKTVRFWGTATGTSIGCLQHPDSVNVVSFSPFGDSVASAINNGKLYVWQVPRHMQSLSPDASLTQEEVGQLQTHPGSNFSTNWPPPPDLTPHIFKKDDSYAAGGGFGDVYRCWYRDGSPKEVAVKALRFRMPETQYTSKRSLKMLRRELGIWRRLKHRNIVPFLGIAYGFGMEGSMSLVSLWMANKSLDEFLTKYNKHLYVRHRLQLLLDIANGLRHLHCTPIVHGDLNSNNVLLDADLTARLTDFGYASLIGDIPEALSYLQRSTARPGALRWIAPEQINFEDTLSHTPKSDIYSFGCVAVQVLSGKQPWSEVRQEPAIVLRLARGDQPGRPESCQIDDSHWNLIQHCWSSIEKRPSAEAIIAHIKQFLDDCPPSPPLHQSMKSSPLYDDSEADRSPSLLDQVTAEGGQNSDVDRQVNKRSQSTDESVYAPAARKRQRES